MKAGGERFGVDLGRWVRQRRIALGMTQEQVWNRMEIPTGESNWVSKLESGRKQKLPDFDYLNGLSLALKATITDVLRGAGVLPEGIEESPEQAPGSATIHALVDMIDWTENPFNREHVEGTLQVIVQKQTKR